MTLCEKRDLDKLGLDRRFGYHDGVLKWAKAWTTHVFWL
jgi:hypothetical protein